MINSCYRLQGFLSREFDNLKEKEEQLNQLDLLVKKRATEVIKNKKLFFSQFACIFNQLRKVSPPNYVITEKNQETKEIKKILELFRKSCQNALTTKGKVERFFIRSFPDAFYFCEIFFEELVQQQLNPLKERFSLLVFDGLVRPYLSIFFSSLGFEYDLIEKPPKILEIHSQLQSIDMTVELTYKENPTSNLSIFMELLPLAHNIDFPGAALYEDYLKAEGTNVTLFSYQEEKLFLHSQVLTKQISGKFQIKKEKEPIFLNYSLAVLRDIVSYFYLGPDQLEQRARAGEKIDAYGLLEFAKTYEIELLAKLAINLLILSAEKQDQQIIKILAIRYQEESLFKLADYLEFF